MLDRWLTLIDRVSDQFRSDAARVVFDDLFARYTAADRRYHDFRHIDACLCLLDSVRGLARHPDSIELAIWFHDAIYDTRRSDNEEASARLAADALANLGVAPAMSRLVSDLIRATRHDTATSDADTALLVDIDLAVLGQPAPGFDEYEAGVRFEYVWVPEPAFRAGRSKILQSFLDRPRIYATSHFHDAFESAARQNLARSLAQLSVAEPAATRATECFKVEGTTPA
jgi:predicted metal-dependent HD superfamily phosphohydrolase